jgi:hypothetical protein
VTGAFREKTRGRDFVPYSITRLPTLSAAELKMDTVEDPRACRFISRL